MVGVTPTVCESAAEGGARWLTLYNLHRPQVITDPWPYYRRLRDEGRYFDPYLRCWLFARHVDMAAVLPDDRFSVAMHHRGQSGRVAAADPALHRMWRYRDRHVSFVDPPDHTRLRALLAPALTRHRIAALEPVIADAAGATAYRLAHAEEPDVVQEVAVPVPLTVLQHLLGLPGIDLGRLRRWSVAWGDVIGAPGHLPTSSPAGTLAPVTDMTTTLTEVVADHNRHRRGEGVIADLVAAEADGWLDHDELIAALMMLVTAGAETTTNLISAAVHTLLHDPELWDQLVADRTMLPAAVEELARLYPPTQYTARRAVHNLEVGGQPVRGGQSVVVVLAAANRDPDAFADPDVFRLDRTGTGRAVTFGRGRHACPGAALARLEVIHTLNALLDLPRPESAGPVAWRRNANLRGLAALPVRWPASARSTVTGRTP